jgi:putative flippase GtrA
MAMTQTLKSLLMSNKALLLQFVRYGVTGGFVTLVGVGVYWVVASKGGYAPLLATLVAYLVAVTIGYGLHSRFSFKDHGSRDDVVGTTSRFLAGSLLSYSLNSLFVWIATGPMHGPVEWGIVPMVFITPVIIFIVNRLWVFR